MRDRSSVAVGRRGDAGRASGRSRPPAKPSRMGQRAASEGRRTASMPCVSAASRAPSRMHANLLLGLLLLPLSSIHRGPDDLAPGEVVEGELAFQLDEFLTRLEGLGFSGVVGVEFEGRPI